MWPMGWCCGWGSSCRCTADQGQFAPLAPQLTICQHLPMHLIEFSKGAAKVLARMPRNLRELIAQKIEAIAADPYGANRNL